MPVKYERTADPNVFREVKTSVKELSLKKLEAQVASLDEQIDEHEDEVPTDKVTPKQKEAIDFFNFQTQDMISNVVDQKDRLVTLIAKLKALPVQLVK